MTGPVQMLYYEYRIRIQEYWEALLTAPLFYIPPVIYVFSCIRRKKLPGAVPVVTMTSVTGIYRDFGNRYIQKGSGR